MSDGWFAVSRDLTNADHDLHPKSRGEPACAAWAWVDLIGMAKWKTAGGVPKGCVSASERFLAIRWNWHRSKVTRFLTELEDEGRISRDPGQGRRQGHIRICNYEVWQDPRTTTDREPRIGPQSEPQIGPQAPRHTTDSGESRTTSEPQSEPRTGPKKNKNKTTTAYTSDFEKIWMLHPRGPKAKAFEEYRKAVPDRIPHARLAKRLKSYVASFERGFRGAHLFRWIRDDRWDEIEAKNGANPLGGSAIVRTPRRQREIDRRERGEE